MKFVGQRLKVLAGGFLAGLVAALFMTVVLALLRLFVGGGLPAELGGDRFLQAAPSEREKRDSSITRTTICLYLPPGERSPSSSS